MNKREDEIDEFLKEKERTQERDDDFFENKQFQREQMKLRSKYLSKHCRK